MKKINHLLQDAIRAISEYPVRDDIHAGVQKKWSTAMRKYLEKDYLAARVLAEDILKILEENK